MTTVAKTPFGSHLSQSIVRRLEERRRKNFILVTAVRLIVLFFRRTVGGDSIHTSLEVSVLQEIIQLVFGARSVVVGSNLSRDPGKSLRCSREARDR